jgi:hypothetical protein
MACHTHAGEYAGRPGASAHGTGVAETVVLTVGLATYTGESVTLHDALETLTFRSTDHINEFDILSEDVGHGDGVSELELSGEVCLEFHELLLGSSSSLFEMALQSLAGALLFLFVIGKLHGGITVGFYSANLRDNTRTSLNDSARDILPVGTEDGNHSDFLSN